MCLCFWVMGFSLADCFDLALCNSCQVKADLISAGWVPNFEKSEWYPVQILVWIGCVFNLIDGVISISDRKIRRALSKVDMVSTNFNIRARFLAGVVGLAKFYGTCYG